MVLLLFLGHKHSRESSVCPTTIWNAAGAGVRKLGGTGIQKTQVEVFSSLAFHLSLHQRKCFQGLRKKYVDSEEKAQARWIYSFI